MNSPIIKTPVSRARRRFRFWRDVVIGAASFLFLAAITFLAVYGFFLCGANEGLLQCVAT